MTRLEPPRSQAADVGVARAPQSAVCSYFAPPPRGTPLVDDNSTSILITNTDPMVRRGKYA